MAKLQSAFTPIKRSKTAAEEVEERLILAIATGEKLPGERITEGELATTLNISRVPVREALQKLQNRGVLAVAPQRGLVVLDYGRDRINELLELRVAIESIFLNTVMLQHGSNSTLLEKLTEVVDRMRELTGSNDSVALSLIDLKFHRTIAAASGNKLGQKIWEGLAQHMLIVLCRDWTSISDRIGEVNLHLEMIDFIRSGDPKECKSFLAAHSFMRNNQSSPEEAK